MDSAMWLLLFIGLGLVLVWGIAQTRKNLLPLKVAYSAACQVQQELEDLRKFREKLHTTLLHVPMAQNVQTVIGLQLAYINDVLFVIRAAAMQDGPSQLEFIARVALSKQYQWTEFVNNVCGTIDSQITADTLPEVRKDADTLKSLLRESAQVVMPLRTKLAGEMRKAGVVWNA
jgi:hypothetical protein